MAPPSPSGCLVLLCGHPASGKSTAAAELSRRIQAAGARVLLVDEPSLHLPRNASYRDARSEKNTRGLLKATVERAVHRDGPVVLLDANNGIKGYRYELWCLARQAGTRFCVVHCETPVDACRKRNSARRDRGGDVGGAGETATRNVSSESPRVSAASSSNSTNDFHEEWGGYDAAVFDDLVFRFERPDGKNRWDAPLFVLEPELDGETSGGAVDARARAEDDARRREAEAGFPRRESFDGYGSERDGRERVLERTVCHALGVPDTTERGGSSKHVSLETRHNAAAFPRAVARSASTQPTHRPADASLRADVDAGAQDIIDCVVRRDAESGGASHGGSGSGGRAQYEFSALQPSLRGVFLRCARAPSLQTLRRLKRTFLRSAAAAAAGAANPRETARRLFVEHVQRDADLGAW